MTRVCVITGAGHRPGIGYQSAIHFANSGYRVIVVSRSFDSLVKEQYQSLNITALVGDINSIDTHNQLIELCNNRLDLLIHNAMSTKVEYINQQLSRNSWLEHLQTGVVSIYELTMNLSPLLINANGCVITVGSRSAMIPGTGNNIAYGVTKAAVISLTKELAVMLSPNVRVNCISPGMVESQRLHNVFKHNWPAKADTWADSSLLKHLVNADDIVSAMNFLVTNKSITSANLVIDSGSSPEIS